MSFALTKMCRIARREVLVHRPRRGSAGCAGAEGAALADTSPALIRTASSGAPRSPATFLGGRLLAVVVNYKTREPHGLCRTKPPINLPTTIIETLLDSMHKANMHRLIADEIFGK